MKLIRKILVSILGLKGYLKLVSRTYIRMIRKGKMRDEYQELYFVQKVVKEGDVCVDIGANLAYYSYFIAQQIGTSGKLIAVEPIPLFADIWIVNMRPWKELSVKLFNCALGSEAKEAVSMSIPIVDGVVRHGLTSVDEGESDHKKVMSFKVPMKVGDALIKKEGVTKIDYIKCDVEGYEQYVIPSLETTIDEFKPLLQIELGGEENRQNVADFLTNKGFEIFILKDELLYPIQKNDIFNVNQDFYFIHRDKLNDYQELIRK